MGKFELVYIFIDEEFSSTLATKTTSNNETLVESKNMSSVVS